MHSAIRTLPALCVAALLLGSLPLNAQKFTEPTREELQMTSDPKAPGAPAVYLDREESTDNANHYVSSYARIKILSELGKEWATVSVPYTPGSNGVPIIEGRTIHADGTVIPLTGKPADLIAFKTNANQVKTATFNLPSVEVGSILEYKWTITLTGGRSVQPVEDSQEGLVNSELASSIPTWEVQTPLYVHKEHFYYNPKVGLESVPGGNVSILHYVNGELASYLLFTQRLPKGFQVSKSQKDDYTLDIQDVPALRHEVNAPPEASLRYRVNFYYTPYLSPDVYWESEAKRLSKQLDQFANPDQSIRNASEQLTAGATTVEAKARKLYDAVQALENTDFTRTKTAAERRQLHLRLEQKSVADVLAEKAGSSYGLAALYLAMARAVGLEAYGLLVVDRDRRLFDPSFLSTNQLDSLVVELRVDGKEIYLDPGEKLCPFGQLHWRHTLAGGLSQNSKTPVFTPNILSKDAITAHSSDLKVDEQGVVTGNVKVLMTGPEALYWRQLALTADATEVEKQFSESLHRVLPEGLQVTTPQFQGLESPSTNLVASVNVSGNLGSLTGKRILLPAFFFTPVDRQPLSDDPGRTYPVDFHFAEQVIDSVTYHLPAGFSVESAPKDTQLPWTGHAALVTKTTTSAGAIEFKRIFARAFVLLEAKEYPALRDYYQKLAANDQQQFIVTSSATPGN